VADSDEDQDEMQEADPFEDITMDIVYKVKRDVLDEQNNAREE